MKEIRFLKHHSIFRTITILTLLLPPLFVCSVQVKAQSTSSPDPIEALMETTDDPSIASKGFVLHYTGALYGYYRIEDSDGENKLEPPDAFLRHKWDTSPFLLGMGDNFGPEFGASIQEARVKLPENGTLGEFTDSLECYLPPTQVIPGHKAVPPETLYKDDSRLPKMAECDNVGRFLMWGGYRAIVPGKEDFLYSARWLRRMALLFQGASDPEKHNKRFPDDGGKTNPFLQRGEIANPDHSIHMLASNLRLRFEVVGFDLRPDGAKQEDTISKALKDECPLLFSWDPLGSGASGPESCVSDGTVTKQMDWLRRLDSTVDDVNIAGTMNRRARVDAFSRRQMLENQAQILSATLSPAICGDSCTAMHRALDVLGTDKAFDKINDPSSTVKLSAAGTAAVTHLQPYLNIAGNLGMVLGELLHSFDYLSEKQDAADFLLPSKARLAGISLLLRKIADQQKNVGYAVAEHYGVKTLIVGVVGQKTMGAVSPANLQLCTQWKELNAQPQTTDLSTCDDIAGARWPNFLSKYGNGRLVGTVQIGEPVLAVTTTVRAAWEAEGPFDKVVVMAQMPFTEAQELAVRVRSSLNKSGNEVRNPNLPHVDLILSEAQPGHTTPSQQLRYGWNETIPVVAPKPAWYITKDEKTLVWPVSIVTIRQFDARGRILTNSLPDDRTSELDESPQAQDLRAKTANLVPPERKDQPLPTMSQMLYGLLTDASFVQRHRSLDLSSLQKMWLDCLGDRCRNSVLQQFLMEQLHRHSNADVILLEKRDFYFGRLLWGYGDNKICDTLGEKRQDENTDMPMYPKEYCQVRVALDRVLWKGDVSERVMVDGKTLQNMLSTAKQDSQDEQSLLARDTVGEWLLTFGVVSNPPQNLSAAGMGPDAFSVPGLPFCKNAVANDTPYCVNGQRVSDDGSYWVSTSDHLAQDNELYKVLKALDPNYHEGTDAFITGEIADELDSQVGKKSVSQPDSALTAVEQRQQSRAILQLDYAKIVAGLMLRRPSLSDGLLAADFSGVTDSRATTPHAGETDLEAVTRMTSGIGLHAPMKVGLQSDLEYDRAFTGNLTGSPETVTYALNSFTTGAFLQYRVLGNSTFPHLLLVAAPYQYQTQITGNYLIFKFTTGTGQITVPTKRWEGFSQRFGPRYEFGGGKWMAPDSGSYAEGGPEYSVINNVLSGISVNGTDCPVLAAAFKGCLTNNNLSIVSGTTLSPLTETLHTGGAYWDVHLQKALDKHKYSSLTIETKGDYFMLPGVTLPTQSRYAFTTTGAVNFAVIGNLAFSPTYTTFFYKNQGPDNHSLVTNSFSVTAKWYFARDASVPFWRQWWFRGPGSFDQTKSAKMK